MKPSTDELIKEFKEHDCRTNKEAHCLEIMILCSKLRGRLDVLEEWVNLVQYEYQSKWIKEEIAKIKEVLK